MRTGLFVDLRNPPGWRRPWAGLYRERLDRLRDAELRGIGSVWLTEHHLFEDGYLPRPLTFAAAVAARTERMRIGTAVLLAGLHHPVAIREDATQVDILSDGRLELGIGAGYRAPEFERFDSDFADRFWLLERRAEQLLDLWDDPDVTPPPLQPRAPLWIGAGGPRTARLAGRLGIGLLTLRRDLFAVYEEALEAAGHDPAGARCAGPVFWILARDPERTRARIGSYIAYQDETYSRYAAEGWPAEKAAHRSATDRTIEVLTTAEAIARLRSELADLPVTDAFFWDSIAAMPEEDADEHLELLTAELAPALADFGAVTGPSPLGTAT